MGKLEEAKGILSAIGMPAKQTNDRSGYVLLALANIKEDDSWENAFSDDKRIVDIMNYMSVNYDKHYKPNSRETIRKDTIHQFIEGAVAENNQNSSERPTNSPNYSYRMTSEMLRLIQSYGTNHWEDKLKSFIKDQGRLIDKYSQQREMVRIPVRINDLDLTFSPGSHNQLQKDIIEEFGSRFAKDSEILYVGDTENKELVKNREKLKELGIDLTAHDKLPDVVLYQPKQNWLYFIEAVTSVGPISVKRIGEIEKMTEKCTCGKIYVTAFETLTVYKKFVKDLAWETEVWISEMPDHMIHLNGDRFMGPRNK